MKPWQQQKPGFRRKHSSNVLTYGGGGYVNHTLVMPAPPKRGLPKPRPPDKPKLKAKFVRRRSSNKTPLPAAPTNKAAPIACVKAVALGDGTVGKTCLLVSFAHNRFPKDHRPTALDNYTTQLRTRQGGIINLSLWDTAGQSDYDAMRPGVYPETDVFLLCFSIASPDSFNNIKKRWIPHLKAQKAAKNVPLVLVGTKADLRHDHQTIQGLLDKGQMFVREADAKELGRDIGAIHYFETSAISQDGLREAFHEAVRIGMTPNKKKRKKDKRCSIM